MNSSKIIALFLVALVSNCEAQWTARFRVDNIATEFLPIKMTLKYEEPIRPGTVLTVSSGTFNKGESRSLELPSNSVKINFLIEYSPFINIWKTIKTSYYEKLPSNRQVRDCYKVWGSQQSASYIPYSC